MGGVFRIAPPLTGTEEELSLGLAILDEAIGDAARGLWYPSVARASTAAPVIRPAGYIPVRHS